MQEIWVQSLGWEEALEEMATHFSIPAWRISWRESWKVTVHGVTELDTTEQLSHFILIINVMLFSLYHIS